jgi:hypothetical protein
VITVLRIKEARMDPTHLLVVNFPNYVEVAKGTWKDATDGTIKVEKHLTTLEMPDDKVFVLIGGQWVPFGGWELAGQ